MKVKTEYICEICQLAYTTPQAALDCEGVGIPVDAPMNLIVGYALHGPSSYITMAVARNNQRTRSHYKTVSYWATRDNGAGDSLGEELCGDSSGLKLWSGNGANTEHPTFLRMVEHLKNIGVSPITYWDGEEIKEWNGTE